MAKQIISTLQKQKIGFELNTEWGDFSTNTQFCITCSPMPKLTEMWLQKCIIRKIFVFSCEISELDAVRLFLKQYDGLSVTTSAPWNIEITSSKAKKGEMIEQAMKYYGISKDEVIVFGDGENDKTMFQIFEHSRAMENAVYSIKQLAEKIIESNIENGVAKEIRRIITYNVSGRIQC